MSLYKFNGRIYDALVYLFTLGSEEPFMRTAIAALNLKPGDRVLDWGCGTGISLRFIENYLPSGRIYAVDRSPTMLQYAVARSMPREGREYHFILRDGVALDLPEQVHATVAAYSLCVLPPDLFEAAAHEIWRSTCQGGKLLMIETHIIPATGLFGRFRQKIRRRILARLFEDVVPDDLLPIVEQYFDRVALDHNAAINARAFTGVRRAEVLPRRFENSRTDQIRSCDNSRFQTVVEPPCV